MTKKKRDEVEIRNNIDTGIWSAEQQLNEYRDQISLDLKNEISDKINEVKSVRDTGNVEQMKEKNGELQKVLMKIGEDVYSKKSTQAENETSKGENKDT